MTLSPFDNFDCDFTANQLTMQYQRSLRRVAEHGKCSPNALQIDLYYCETKKLFIFTIGKQVKLKKKCLFRRFIRLITSEEDINFSESFNLEANKKHKLCPKNQNRKEKCQKPVSFRQWWSLAWASGAVARGPPTLFCALQGPPKKVNVTYLPQIFVAHLRLL